MIEVRALIFRNTKLFFKDKGIFFTSLITPLILLVLYATFLGNIYRDSFTASIPEGLMMPDDVIDGCVGGQLISSILAVSCVTVSFCCNMLMVQDKAMGVYRDLTITPVKRSAMALSYYCATLISSLIICFAAMAVCLIYLAVVGWYLSAMDVLLLSLDVFLLVMFGTALSSAIGFFLSSQGQISAVGTIISSGYGFICGAYMPISQFSDGLQKVISFLPGTYATALVRNHAMRGVFEKLGSLGLPNDSLQMMRDSIDCNLYLFGARVALPVMYLILGGSIAACVAIYILLNVKRSKIK